MSRVMSNLDWLVNEGFVRMVDKVIKLPYFLHDVGRIIHMCFAAGEEFGRETLHKKIDVGTFDPRAASSTSIHTREMVGAIDSFLTYHYTFLMKLGSLYINGLLRLYTDDNGG
ncbi:unnamed protein product [Lactuca saligna]|uniref:Uncharacterized protein n=1 Tax=Lactuca saligna TaxID=75948 RepID=A0AA36E231_LACSI|nr:unnamed protein product [Lactuca saligna]